MTTYQKIDSDTYKITETKEEDRTVSLKFIDEDIAHKDKLIANLQQGITDLEIEKAELVSLKNELLKVK